MAKTFDFNALTQETLETKLGGPDNITVHVTTPPERLIEQMVASQGEIASLMSNEGVEDAGDTRAAYELAAKKSRAAYELAAKLISCNTEGITITAGDLRDKYKIYPTALALYLATYMEFINDYHNAKN